MSKKILVALSPAFLEALDHIARAEQRTRSDTLREAVRKYIEDFKKRNFDLTDLDLQTV